MSQDPKKPQFPLMRPDQDRNRQQKPPKGGGTPPPERRSPRIPTWVVASLIIALIGWYIWEFFGPSDNENVTGVTYSAITEQIEAGNVERPILSRNQDRGRTRRPRASGIPRTNVIDNDAPADAGISPKRSPRGHIAAGRRQPQPSAASSRIPGRSSKARPSSGSLWTSLLFSFLPFLLFLGLIVFMGRQMSRGQQNVFGFGRSKARQNDPERPQVTFADVAGEDEAKQELMEVVDFLRNPAKYHALGARLPRGVLLVGPPGTGKTLTARAVAGEAGVPFFSVSASEFVEMFVGVGASRVRDLFDKAKAAAPAIIFVDEMDAVGRQRFAGLGGSNDEREQTLNQLLVEMDGFETNQEVIVMAATNRPDVLDPALLRPGPVRSPGHRWPAGQARPRSRSSASTRVAFRSQSEVDLEHIARSTTGFSGADLSNLVNEAALTAARRNRKEILQAGFR